MHQKKIVSQQRTISFYDPGLLRKPLTEPDEVEPGMSQEDEVKRIWLNCYNTMIKLKSRVESRCVADELVEDYLNKFNNKL